MTKKSQPVDRFKAQKAAYVDYKDIRKLRRYVQSTGQIQPSRYSGLSPRSQRMVTQAIKRARMVGLLPFVR